MSYRGETEAMRRRFEALEAENRELRAALEKRAPSERAIAAELEPSTEIARLAREGQQRIAEASASRAAVKSDAGERHLRIAIGGHRGSPRKRAFLAMLIASLLTMFMAGRLAGPLAMALMPIALASFFLWIFIEPKASRAQVAAERAWARALPFALDGYFEAISASPASECRLEISLEWAVANGAPDDATVKDVFGVLDPQVRRARGKLISRGISGSTGIRTNGVFVYRNARVVGYVHDLVEKVLLPLHRGHALARVTLSRA